MGTTVFYQYRHFKPMGLLPNGGPIDPQRWLYKLDREGGWFAPIGTILEKVLMNANEKLFLGLQDGDVIVLSSPAQKRTFFIKKSGDKLTTVPYDSMGL